MSEHREGNLAVAMMRAVEAYRAMTPEQKREHDEAQRQSWARGMAPCEHGVSDWETCPDCRAKYADPQHDEDAVVEPRADEWAVRTASDILHECGISPFDELGSKLLRLIAVQLTWAFRTLGAIQIKPGDRLPGGQQSLPAEPTNHMLLMGARALRDTFSDPNQQARAAAVYRAMLSAAASTD